jgi:hypothetical protein
MEKQDFGYCGLNCTICKSRFTGIRRQLDELEASFDMVNMKGIAKAIPFMYSKYKGYKKLVHFFKNECPGCRDNGGNPFCSIRKCAKKKGHFTCVDCESDMCKKFKTILKIHTDNEIQNNREVIKNLN